MAKTTTFGQLEEGDYFVIVEEPESNQSLEVGDSASFFRKSPADQVGIPGSERHYAEEVFSLIDTIEVHEGVDDDTVVLKVSSICFYFLSSFSVPYTRIGPPPKNRPLDFFEPGQKVWVLKRGHDVMEWLPATIDRIETHRSMGTTWGPFVYLEENMEKNPGSGGAIRFDSADIWPRE